MPLIALPCQVVVPLHEENDEEVVALGRLCVKLAGVAPEPSEGLLSDRRVNTLQSFV